MGVRGIWRAGGKGRSKYRTGGRTICEKLSGLKSPAGYGSVNDILSQAAPLVFNFEWPIFDEAYRRVLEIKILKHFYTREIGLETVGLWKLKLDTKMNEIMPYYNQLYKTELLEFNPLYDVDLTRDRTEEREGSNKTDGGFNNENVYGKKNNYSEDNTVNSDTTDDTTTSGASDTTGSSTTTENNTRTGKNTDRYSDTPQGAISDLESNSYLTNARIVDSNDTNTVNNKVDNNENLNYNDSIERNVNRKDDANKTGENEESGSSSDNGTNYSYQNITDTNKYLEHVKGKQGSKSYSEMIIEYRKTFLNIDMMVIEELEPLFMQLW